MSPCVAGFCVWRPKYACSTCVYLLSHEQWRMSKNSSPSWTVATQVLGQHPIVDNAFVFERVNTRIALPRRQKTWRNPSKTKPGINRGADLHLFEASELMAQQKLVLPNCPRSNLPQTKSTKETATNLHRHLVEHPTRTITSHPWGI